MFNDPVLKLAKVLAHLPNSQYLRNLLYVSTTCHSVNDKYMFKQDAAQGPLK